MADHGDADDDLDRILDDVLGWSDEPEQIDPSAIMAIEAPNWPTLSIQKGSITDGLYLMYKEPTGRSGFVALKAIKGEDL